MVKVDGFSIGVIARLMETGTPEAVERGTHFATQGGIEGYFSERADLASYLMQHSETPDRYKNPGQMVSPGGVIQIDELTFPFFTHADFYRLVADFYETQRPIRGVTQEKVVDFMRLHKSYFSMEEGKLKISDVHNLVGMLANCL